MTTREAIEECISEAVRERKLPVSDPDDIAEELTEEIDRESLFPEEKCLDDRYSEVKAADDRDTAFRPRVSEEPRPRASEGNGSQTRLVIAFAGVSVAVAIVVGIIASGQSGSFLPGALAALLTCVPAGLAYFFSQRWLLPDWKRSAPTSDGSDKDLVWEKVRDVGLPEVKTLSKGTGTETDTHLIAEIDRRDGALRQDILDHVEKISVFFESLFEKHVFRINGELRDKEAELQKLCVKFEQEKEQWEATAQVEKKYHKDRKNKEAQLKSRIAELEDAMAAQDKECKELSAANAWLMKEAKQPGQGDPPFLEEFASRLRVDLQAAAELSTTLGGKGKDRGAKGVSLQIRSPLKRMDHLLCQVADLARLQASTEKTALSDVRVRDLLKEVTEEFRKRANKKGVKLSVRVSKNVRDVVSDRALLASALKEILGNAVAYTDEDGRVAVSAAVEKNTGASSKLLRIKVKDSGIGVGEHDRERIFEPFKQGKDPRASIAGVGAGLGLTLARGYARQLGGDVHLESEPGAGSTFTLEVPMPTASARTKRAKRAPRR